MNSKITGISINSKILKEHKIPFLHAVRADEDITAQIHFAFDLICCQFHRRNTTLSVLWGLLALPYQKEWKQTNANHSTIERIIQSKYDSFSNTP